MHGEENIVVLEWVSIGTIAAQRLEHVNLGSESSFYTFTSTSSLSNGNVMMKECIDRSECFHAKRL